MSAVLTRVLEVQYMYECVMLLLSLQMDRVVLTGERCRYRVRVFTGSRQGASTKADIKLVLCGSRGRSEEISLGKPTNHVIPFQKGQVRNFTPTVKD